MLVSSATRNASYTAAHCSDLGWRGPITLIPSVSTSASLPHGSCLHSEPSRHHDRECPLSYYCTFRQDCILQRHMGQSECCSNVAHTGHAHMCPQGCSTTLASASQHTTHSEVAQLEGHGCEPGMPSSAGTSSLWISVTPLSLVAAGPEARVCIFALDCNGLVSVSRAILLAGLACCCSVARLACATGAVQSLDCVRSFDTCCSRQHHANQVPG